MFVVINQNQFLHFNLAITFNHQNLLYFFHYQSNLIHFIVAHLDCLNVFENLNLNLQFSSHHYYLNFNYQKML